MNQQPIYQQPIQGVYNPNMAPGTPTQYYQQPQQPVYQAPSQVTTTNTTNAPVNESPEILHKVSFVLDDASIKILQEAYAIHAEAIINIGIKLFAETDTYKQYMKKEEFKTEEEVNTISPLKSQIAQSPTKSEAIVSSAPNVAIPAIPAVSWN